MATEITIEVNKEGDSTISVEGVKGKKCKDVTRAFEEALGIIQSDVETAEYHEEPEQQQRQKAVR